MRKQYIGSIQQFNSILKTDEDIVICGAATFYKLLVDYLADRKSRQKVVGIIDIDCVEKESKEYAGITIYGEPQTWEKHRLHRNFLTVVAADKLDKSKAIRILEDWGITECVLCADHVIYEWRTRMEKRERVNFKGLDFIIAGFPKCGTTSIHFALQQLENIYLPQQKEPHFFEWCEEVENPWRLLGQKFYADIRSGQLVGAVDPTLQCQAERVFKTFGGEAKICLVIRNPVNAEFSRYKMMNRHGAWRSMERLYDEKGSYCDEMFDAHCEVLETPGKLTWNYEYIGFLEDFSAYYPCDQIKVIIFEELIRCPQKQMNELLKFVGADENYIHTDLPHDNSGDFVWRTRESYRIARDRSVLRAKELFHTFHLTEEEKIQLRIEVLRLESEMSEEDKLYGLRLTPDQRRRLEDFYRPSVRRLEKMLNRDLSKLWFK